MGFQQNLQGGQPTATRMQRDADTTNVDMINIAAKTAQTLIGSSYAEAQSEKMYESALGDYGAAKQELSKLETNLVNKTQTYETSGRPPELLAEMKSLEDTIRKAKMGEASGVLSGLAAKSRIDSAVKMAIGKFPKFQQELLIHKDITTGGGAYQAAIEESELSMEMAKDEAKNLADEMNKYGLSYFNKQDRLFYQTQAAMLGRLKMKNQFLKEEYEPLMTKMDFEAKRLGLLNSGLDYKYKVEDRPTELAQKEATLNNTLQSGDAGELELREKKMTHEMRMSAYIEDTNYKRREQRHQESMWPLQKQQAELNYDKGQYEFNAVQENEPLVKAKREAEMSKIKAEQDWTKGYQVRRNLSKTADIDLHSTVIELSNGGKSSYTPEQKVAYLQISANQTKRSINDFYAASGMTNSEDHKLALKEIDDNVTTVSEMFKASDPAKIKKYTLEAQMITQQFGAMESEDWKLAMLITNTGMRETYNTLLRTKTDIDKMQNGSEKNAAMESYKKLVSTQPAELQKALGYMSETGEAPENYGKEGVEAGKVLTKSLDGAEPEVLENKEVVNIAKATLKNDLTFDAMATKGAMKLAGIDSSYKELYKGRFNDLFQQTAALLPDGYGLQYTNGGTLDIVDVKSGEIVTTFSRSQRGIPTALSASSAQRGALNASDLMGFDMTALKGLPRGTDTSGLFNNGAKLDYIIKNNGNIIEATGMWDRSQSDPNAGQQVSQVKTFMGSVGDFAEGAASNYVDARDKFFTEITGGDTVSNGVFLKRTYTSSVGTAKSGDSYKSIENSILQGWERKGSEFADTYREASEKYGVPIDILIRQGGQESRFWDDKVVTGNDKSSAGAAGIAQFMPATAREYGLRVDKEVDERLDPHKSIMVQAQMMAKEYKRTGSWRVALAAYNAGFGNVQRKDGTLGVPNFRETKDYINIILGDSND